MNKEIEDILMNITKNQETWNSYLRTVSTNFGLDVKTQIVLWKHNNASKAVLPDSKWLEMNYEFDENTAFSSNGISYHCIEDVRPKENAKDVRLWYYDDAFKDTLVNHFSEMYKFKSSDLDTIIGNYAKLKSDSVFRINSNSAENELLRDSIECSIRMRLGFSHNDCFALNRISFNNLTAVFEQLNRATKEFVREVKKLAYVNEKTVNYTFDSKITEIYNEDENNFKEESDDGIRYDNDYRGLRDDNGYEYNNRGIGRTGGLRENSGLLFNQSGANEIKHSKLGNSDGEISSSDRAGRDDFSSPSRTAQRNEVRGIHQGTPRQGTRSSIQTQGRNSGKRRQLRVTGRTLVGICTSERKRSQTGEGNSVLEVHPQLNLFDNLHNGNAGSENELAFFIYENYKADILRGTGIQDGKFRVYEYFLENVSSKDRAEFLKQEYGLGGRTIALNNGENSFADWSAKGYLIQKFKDENSTELTWQETASIIGTLIDDNEYLSEKELAEYSEYKEQQEIKNKQYVFTNLLREFIEKLNNVDFEIRDKLFSYEFEQNKGFIYDFLLQFVFEEKYQKEAGRLVDEFIKIEPEYHQQYVFDVYFKNQKEYPDAVVLIKNGNFFEVYDKTERFEEYGYVIFKREYNDRTVKCSGFVDKQLDEVVNRLISDNERVIVLNYEDSNYKYYQIVSDERKVAVGSEVTAITADDIKDRKIFTLDDLSVELEKISRINTKSHLNYIALHNIVPMIFNDNVMYITLSAGEAFDRIIIEKLTDNLISVADYYEQNNDLMKEPDIVYLFDSEKQELRPREYQNDTVGTYKRVENDGIVDMRYEAELSNFTENWFNTISEQDYKVQRVVINYQDNEVILNFNGNGELVFTEPQSFADENNLRFADTSNVDEKVKTAYDVLPTTEITGTEGENFNSDKFMIYCNWSEHPSFNDDTTYDFAEFNSAMEYLDNEVLKLKKEYEDKDDYYPYYKVSFSLLFPDGRKIDERQDIGDGFGSTLNLMRNYLDDNTVKLLENQIGVMVNDKVNYVISDDEIGVGGKKERFRNNINAINVLKKCHRENRFATPDEQAVLAKYVGWGGLSETFDEHNGSWVNEYKEIIEILSPEEYESARGSVLTAFYTPPVIIKSIYKALENFGLKDGLVLEPSCGVGNFFGLLPNELQGLKMVGVEIDSISGQIARQLYQNNDIQIKGFEDTRFADNSFDAIVGNVPFGQEKVYDKEYNSLNFMIHDYFFAKALDKVKSGGIIAFITSKGTLDKDNPTVRKYIAKRAELLGAVRLPNNVFKRAAGTEVTSDIIFLQKREKQLDIEPEWVNLSADSNGIVINSYFAEHPNMVLGNMQMVSTAHGYDSTCTYDGRDLSVALDNAVKEIKGSINVQKDVIEEVSKLQTDNSENLPPLDEYRIGEFAVINGRLYSRQTYEMEYIKCSDSRIKCCEAYISLRNACRGTIDLQANSNSTDEEVRLSQDRLNSAYDEFVKEYGRICDKKNERIFKNEASYSLLSTLEKYKNGKFERKADIFYKRTIRPVKVITKVENSNEALIVSLSRKGKIDIEYMKQLTGFDEDKLVSDLKGVIYHLPLFNDNENHYVTADDYLSGNVIEKLNTAKIFKEIKRADWVNDNIKALERVQPEKIGASNIKVRLGATWLPEDIVNDFIYDTFNVNAYKTYLHANYNEVLGAWTIENAGYESGSVAARTTYGTNRINGYQLLEDALNLKNTVVRDKEVDEDGKEKYVVNDKETRLAQGKQKLIKKTFDDWIWKDSTRRERIEEIYNERFNSNVLRKYDGSHLEFEGMNCNITLRPHQKNAIARGLYSGCNSLFAHCVGAGKTFEMIALAMESKRIGLCKKSMFVVPNNIINQFAQDFLELYPQANILSATEKDFSKENRRRFCSRIATGDYDAVIIGHSQFEKIPLNIENQKELLQEQMNEVVNGIALAKSEGGNYITVKALERSRKSIQHRLDKLNDIVQDDIITFEQLGVDKLFVDEAHNYKNLYLYTKMTNIAGINTTEAKKSSDMYNKIQWINKHNPSGVVFATGTPVSNTMAELYTMQRYLQPHRLKQLGLQHFDAWASTFGETVQELELKPEGTGFHIKERFAKFYNIPELMNVFREVADIQTAEMLDLPVPECNFESVRCSASDFQKDYVADLAERADKVRDGGVSADVDNMLKIVSDGRKLALDQRIIDKDSEDYDGSKVNTCVNNVYEIWSKTAENKSAQLVFCDLSTPNSKQFNVYDDIKNKLIVKGIPENEVAFIHDASTNAQKEELFKKVRAGTIRVLLGSTQKCGTGTNAQDRLIAIHDLDCPWRPADLEQRLGRIVRQGNQNNEVWCYRYVTEGTFDAYSWQTVEKKQRFISQIMGGDTTIRELDDLDSSTLSYAKLKALAVNDPLIQEKMELEFQVRDLILQKSNFQTQIFNLQDQINLELPRKISISKAKIEALKADIEAIKNAPDDKVRIKGIALSEPKEIGAMIKTVSNEVGDNNFISIGEYKGVEIRLRIDDFGKNIVLNFGKSDTERELGLDNTSNGKKVLASLDDIETQLSSTEQVLSMYENNLVIAKKTVGEKFPQEAELAEKQSRLDEINAVFDSRERNKIHQQKVQNNNYVR